MIRGGFKNMNADQIIQCILVAMLKLEKTVNSDLKDKLDRDGYLGTAQTLYDAIITEIQNRIDADASTLQSANNYTNSKVSTVYKVKGSVANYASLPASGQEVGDVWNLLDTGMNYVWTGVFWDALGTTVNVTGKEDKANKQNSLISDGTGEKYPTVDATNAALSLKLDKGTYTGNAGNLKSDIDSIYQPDVLISSVPPTRSVNTFTYPATQYQARINKITRNNPAQFITTINVASTTDHKRIDLIWFKDDNTLVKEVGVESLTVAERPNIPVGQTGVPVSFINVFGNVVETPTPIINQISVQDSNGVEIFTVAENGFIQFKGVTINGTAKRIEVDPVVGGVIFVSNSGNDSTAQPENRNKPYKTLNAAITAFWSNPSIVYIEIIDNSTYTTNLILNNGTTRKFDLRSSNSCTVNITTTTTYILSGQELNINMPSGTVVFNPTTAGSVGFLNGIVNLTIKNLEFGANYQPSWGNTNAVSIISENLTIRTTIGIVEGSGGTRKVYIKATTIFFRGAGARLTSAFMNVTLDFNTINHDNTFVLNSNANTTLDVDHGSVVSVAPYVNTTNVKYMFGTNANVRYKNGAVINSNITIDKFNTTGNLIISGIVTANNSDSLVSNVNTSGLQFINASITTKNLIGKDAARNNTGYIIITNSYIRLTGGGYLVSYKETATGITYVSPTLEFFGSNYVIGDTDGFALTSDETLWVSSNNPTIQMTRGSLNTNGKFNRQTVNIIESPLNQYFDTVQRQLVLVDEKEEIINKVLDSTKTYVINGNITLLTGEYIQVPAGGLTIQGYGYDVSGITKNVSAESIFISPSGNSGNLTLSSCFFNSGTGSVFNIIDSTGAHAIEINDVNFNSCSSLGTLNGYRQFTGTTCGIYSCLDGLIFEGNWSGLKLTNSNVIGFGASGTLFKKGTATVFSNRFYIDLNLQIATGSKICDFAPANFTNDKSLQVVNCYLKVNGVIDPNTTATTFPNILETNSKAYFVNNIGIKNSSITPYGISAVNIPTYANDAAAAAGGIIVGQIYIEASTGYPKVRLV